MCGARCGGANSYADADCSADTQPQPAAGIDPDPDPERCANRDTILGSVSFPVRSECGRQSLSGSHSEPQRGRPR